jgi:hypothetical protein
MELAQAVTMDIISTVITLVFNYLTTVLMRINMELAHNVQMDMT